MSQKQHIIIFSKKNCLRPEYSIAQSDTDTDTITDCYGNHITEVRETYREIGEWSDDEDFLEKKVIKLKEIQTKINEILEMSNNYRVARGYNNLDVDYAYEIYENPEKIKELKQMISEEEEEIKELKEKLSKAIEEHNNDDNELREYDDQDEKEEIEDHVEFLEKLQNLLNEII